MKGHDGAPFLALGKTLKSVATSRPAGSRLEGAEERPHDPRVGRNAPAARNELDLRLQGFGQTEGDPGAEIVTGRRRRLGLTRTIVDEDELRIAPREAHLDVPGGELRVECQRRLGEHVEEPQLERRRDGSGQALACRSRGVVAERRGCREIGLDCLNVPFDVQVVEYMTSL